MSLWARIVLSPSSKRLTPRKAEIRLRSEFGITQLWAQTSDGGASPDNDPQLIVLRLLGARGRAELATQDPADRLRHVRSVTWTLNPPRFGASSGPLDADRYLQSALEAYDFLIGRYAGVPIWVYGKCIGGTMALALAAQRKPRALIVKNAVDLPELVVRRAKKWVGAPIATWASRRVPAAFNPRISAPAAHSPALFVISSDDAVASPVSQEAVVACYGGPVETLRILGGHDQAALDPADEPRYAEVIGALWGHMG